MVEGTVVEGHEGNADRFLVQMIVLHFIKIVSDHHLKKIRKYYCLENKKIPQIAEKNF